MQIDKIVFLALATSLSAVACGATSEEDAAEANGAIRGEGDDGADQWCGWNPVTESAVGGPSSQALTQDLKDTLLFAGDPASFESWNGRDYYPYAEGFCIGFLGGPETRVSWAGLTTEEYNLETSRLYDKCKTYAQLYVPFTTYGAYYDLARQLQRESAAHTPAPPPPDAAPAGEGSPGTGPKWTVAELQGKFKALDAAITNKDTVRVCPTDDAKAACASSSAKADCESIGSQLKPKYLTKFKACVTKPGRTPASCVTGNDIDPS